jgi:hypothetical protein
MTRTVIFGFVCAVFGVACDIKHFEGCEDDEWSDIEPPDRPGHSGGSGNSGNQGGSTAGGSGSASQAGSGGSTNMGGSGPSEPPPTPCSEESDCEPGFNCDYERSECVPADAETCAELEGESACDTRNDCVTIYAGTDCSCGPECACIGGEPGCVCQSFEFFQCTPLDE